MFESLCKRWAGAFDAQARARGERYCRDGRVELLEATDEVVAAEVHGRDSYIVEVESGPGDTMFDSFCSCPAHRDDSPCKHVWATLRAVDDLAGQIGVVAGAGDAGGAFTVGLPHESVPVAPEPPSWERRLAPFLNAAADIPTVVPRLEYYLEYVRGFALSEFTIRLRSRNPGVGGEFGPPRTTPVPTAAVPFLPSADQRLLTQYQREAGSTRRWRTGDEVELRHPWEVSETSLPAVLQLLAATGNVFAGAPPKGKQEPVPLTIDVEQPYGFELVRGPQVGGVIELVGQMRRGDEVMPLGRLSWGEADQRYVLQDRRVVCFEFGGARELALEFGRNGPLRVPADELPTVLGRLATVPGAARFLAAEIASLPLGRPVAIAVATGTKSAKQPVRFVIWFDYDGHRVLAHEHTAIVAGPPIARRDPTAEAGLLAAVRGAGLMEGATGFECERAKFAAVVAQLIAAGVMVLAEGQRVRSFATASASITTEIDWFEVEGEVQFDGHTAALPELLRHALTPDGFVQLGDGSFGVLPATWIERVERLRMLGGDVDAEAERVRLPSSQALLLDAMLAERADDIDVDRKFAALRRRLAAFSGVEPKATPRAFRGELRPYQRNGTGWLEFLADFGLGGCLADDMGLGKTVQVLAHLVRRAGRRGARKPNLLVAPRSVVSNWQSEAAKFTPRLRVLDFSGSDRWAVHGDELVDADLVLTTYALMRRDAVEFAERGHEFDYAILDEAQAIKNAQSQTAKAVRLLTAEHRLALTGTPVENHLGELWSIFEFLNPGMLGRLPAFRAVFDGTESAEEQRKNRELLQRALRPVMLRRTKAEVLTDLPPKIEQVLWCDMAPAQKRRYVELRDHYRAALLGKKGASRGAGELDNKERFLVLEALLRLRQAACHEGLLDIARRDAVSAKLDVLLERLEELVAEGHKVLVFSQFTKLLDLVQVPLRERGIGFERLDGRTRNRQQRLDQFVSDPKCPVFLISLKAGGTGLNLTAADYVFLLDPWWNPAVEQQAIDRTHRIGQERTVHAYRLICRGTVEERVLELQDQKRELVAAILGSERSLLRGLTRADLDLLLR